MYFRFQVAESHKIHVLCSVDIFYITFTIRYAKSSQQICFVMRDIS
jgi:hypothetical protein